VGYCLQTVEGQKRNLEESEQLLNQRRFGCLYLKFVAICALLAQYVFHYFLFVVFKYYYQGSDCEV
jgi:hypothetical protein